MASITTKVGDKGNTRLWSGEEVRKTDERIEFCGLIDELVSQLGVGFASAEAEIDSIVLSEIENVQRELFVLASEVATQEPRRSELERKIGKEAVSELEVRMKRIEEVVNPAKGWILPGASIVSAQLDVARCMARRCERSYVSLLDNNLVDNEDGLIWLNRISDYLYLLARYQERNQYRVIKHHG